jgi:hypothetical protein
MNSWRESRVFRVAVYALCAVALIAFLVRMRHPSTPHAASLGDDRPPVTVSPSPTPVAKTAAPPHVNSLEILARCQPELKETPSVPTFQIGENYNRAAVQLRVRFMVDYNGFVLNTYVSSASVVTPADQEAALDYVRHLSFETPTAEECQTIKMQMVGNFHMSKDSGGDWTTVFEVHPVYSFSGDKVVVNPI